ncbi:sulfite exporter TauE/SafE family protein [Paenibacillus antri]|uniref:Probable membrane transporter protein n=1 Tax=Paenibacillus antri TaxID=2582848 RepID=A0A5R9G406_9BACL|nr:sulfite exporter TauE/SafE family protein [Paenibacillus antri]TLS51112.1 sulfite exporter TauE/SafE family protein [Paenibacillus antri]
MDITTAIIGLCVGFLVGLTGVGGAALLTPVLIWFGFPATVAVGTDLFYNSITKLFGGFQHWRQHTVKWKLVGYLASGSIPGAVIAVGLLKVFDQFFDNQEHVIRTALGIMLVVVAAAILLRLIGWKTEKENKWQAKPMEEKKWLTVGIGFALGFVVGLTSVGSGSLFAIAIIYLFRLKSSEVVGTDIVHAFFLVTVAGALHAGMGNVDYGLAFNLLIGSVPGVLAGSALSTKVPSKPLRAVVATLILLSGIKLI